MMKRYINFALIGFLVFSISCSENKNDKKSQQTIGFKLKDRSQTIQKSREQKKVSNVHIPERIRPKPTDDEVERSVKEFMVDMAKSKNNYEFVFSKWDDFWLPEFDKPLVATGQEVSFKLKKYVDGLIPNLAESLPRVQENWMKNDEMRKSVIIMMGSSAVLVERNGINEQGEPSAGDLPKLIGKYQNRMPPTTGDLLLLRITGVTKLLMESSPNLTDSQLLEWTILAEAQNPIYRMIALDLFEKFASTPDQAKIFYESFERDPEVGILKKLTQDLISKDEEWAKALIQKTRKKLNSK